MEEHDNMGEEVARSEQLMQVLLDMDACARDVVDRPRGIEPDLIVAVLGVKPRC
jgi:hypothetical protein